MICAELNSGPAGKSEIGRERGREENKFILDKGEHRVCVSAIIKGKSLNLVDRERWQRSKQSDGTSLLNYE